jgi:hypothetical protein
MKLVFSSPQTDDASAKTTSQLDARDKPAFVAVEAALNPIALEDPFADLATVLARTLGDFSVIFEADATGGLRPTAAATRDPADQSLADRVMELGPPPASHPASRCYREKRSLVVDLSLNAYATVAGTPERLRTLQDSAARYGIVAPLVLDARCLGVVGVSSRARAYTRRGRSSRPYCGGDRESLQCLHLAKSRTSARAFGRTSDGLGRSGTPSSSLRKPARERLEVHALRLSYPRRTREGTKRPMLGRRYRRGDRKGGPGPHIRSLLAGARRTPRRRRPWTRDRERNRRGAWRSPLG